jgi:hypothetical protein
MRCEAINLLGAGEKRPILAAFESLNANMLKTAIRPSAGRPGAHESLTSNSAGVCQQFDDRILPAGQKRMDRWEKI